MEKTVTMVDDKTYIQLKVDRRYLNKSYCLEAAATLIDTEGLLKMDIRECAYEIYAHTVAYYFAEKLKKFNMKLDWLISHANPIDLEDGGDKPWRKAAYRVLWLSNVFDIPAIPS